MGNTAEKDPKDLAATAPTGGVPAGWSGFPIAYALRRALRKGYSARDFRADVLAG